MATIRQWLVKGEFQPETGRIIYQPVEDGKYPGWVEPVSAKKIGWNDPILDLEFNSGHGGPECPRFIAEDKENLYFPTQYDGATSLTVVRKDISFYLDPKNETPYPGE